LQEVGDARVSVSVTTRAPRVGETDGVDYCFVSEDAFDQLVQDDALLEWAFVYGGCRYGTLRKAVEDHVAQGRQVILEIDVQGGAQVRDKMPGAHFVFIEPPSLAVLEGRLRGRATETDEMIGKRLYTAELELSQKMDYDVRLVNDDLEKAVSELVSYVNEQAERERG